MPIDKLSLHYQAGRNAFHDGIPLADKPGEYVLNDWDAGWHDAHAEMTRQVVAAVAAKK
jgi:Xaa-Pro aminopeptidase